MLTKTTTGNAPKVMSSKNPHSTWLSTPTKKPPADILSLQATTSGENHVFLKVDLHFTKIILILLITVAFIIIN